MLASGNSLVQRRSIFEPATINAHMIVNLAILALTVTGLSCQGEPMRIQREIERFGGRADVDDDGQVVYVGLEGKSIIDSDLDLVMRCPHLGGLALSDTSITAAGLSQLTKLSELRGLVLIGKRVDDKLLSGIGNLVKLTSLTVDQTTITNSGMQAISQLKNLEFLSLHGNRIGGAGMMHLRNLKSLKSLFLVETDVDDAGLEHLKGLTQLDTLLLAGTRISGDGLRHLESLKQLKTLRLDSTQLNSGALIHLKPLTALEVVDLDNTQIDATGLRHIQDLPSLKKVRLQGTKVTEQEDFDFSTALPRSRTPEVLEIRRRGGAVKLAKAPRGFYVQGVNRSLRMELTGPQFGDAQLSEFKDQGNLNISAVSVRGSRVTDAGVKQLCEIAGASVLGPDFENFVELDLGDTGVGDAALEYIKDMIDIERLTLDGTKVTNAGLARLKSLSNLKVLSLNRTQIDRDRLSALQSLPSLRDVQLAETGLSAEEASQFVRSLPANK